MLSPQKIERQYDKAQRQLKQGKLSPEAYFRQVGTWQDYDRDGRFYQLGYDGQWLVFDPAYACWFLTGKRVRAPVQRHATFISLLSLILIVAILLTLPVTRHWILLRLPSGLVPDFTHYQAPEVPTTEESPARDQALTPDITLHAPAGVLNGDEALSAYEVSWDDASNQMTQAGLPYPVLYAFEFEAGLWDRLAWPVRVAGSGWCRHEVPGHPGRRQPVFVRT